MNPFPSAYRLFSSGLFLLCLPPAVAAAAMSTRLRTGLVQRMGRCPTVPPPGRDHSRVWMHAASVGEVKAALAVAAALRRREPGVELVVSTTTAHGHRFATERFGTGAVCVLAPVDAVPAVRAALTRVRPHVMVWMETELWPNWIFETHRRGIASAVVNGRISVRSVRRYRRIRPLMAEVLQRIDALSMIHAEDARRILDLGARPERVSVCGNAKGDAPKPSEAARSAGGGDPSRLYRTEGSGPVLVAGSTRSGEEELVYAAFRIVRQAFPDALLIVAPRHIRRARLVAQMAEQAGFSCQLRTDIDPAARPRSAAVVVLDTMGELLDAYGVATVAFCGGSLVEKGGQNLLEAASWGKPVLYGPSTEDFQEARELLEAAGGGNCVASARELADRFVALASDPERSARVGENALRAAAQSRGAAERHAAVVRALLRDRAPTERRTPTEHRTSNIEHRTSNSV